MKNAFRFLAVLLIFIHIGCTSDTRAIPLIVKHDPSDKSAGNLPKSLFYEIDNNMDNVISSPDGIQLFIPKGCFKNADGPVKIELAEALHMDEYLPAGLTSPFTDRISSTAAVLFFNATANGKQLAINPENPVYVEIPANGIPGELQLHKGVRDSLGNMIWKGLPDPDKGLLTIDPDLLDFYPTGYERAVEAGMPYKTYKSADKKLKDSLYYGLESDVVSNLYTAFSAEIPRESQLKNPRINVYSASDTIAYQSGECGIEPMRIKTLRSDKYRQTLIATREFEARLKLIFKTCNNKLIDLYVNNINKNLWEIDSMAADMLHGDIEQEKRFRQWASEKRTRVLNGKPYVEQAEAYYENELTRNREEQAALFNEVRSRTVKSLQGNEKLKEKYRALLSKREKFRMEKLGFEVHENGWIHAGYNEVYGKMKEEQLLVHVPDSGFSRTHVYIIFNTIQSIYRMYSDNDRDFYTGPGTYKGIFMPMDETASVLTIAYKEEIPYVSLDYFFIGETENLHVNPVLSSPQKLKTILKSYRYLNNVNDIERDLLFMDRLLTDKKQQAELNSEIEFMRSLRNIVYSCCSPYRYGETLFQSNCSRCHYAHTGPLVGPGLWGSTSKHKMPWLIEFTRNSTVLLKRGDKDALYIFNLYNKSAHPHFSYLSDEDIKAIFSYVDQ
ncbi:MAG: cytochrome c [Bacteroidia bacterium]|nr:cytochrome c [Bacteroidia bacterium]